MPAGKGTGIFSTTIPADTAGKLENLILPSPSGKMTIMGAFTGLTSVGESEYQVSKTKATTQRKSYRDPFAAEESGDGGTSPRATSSSAAGGPAPVGAGSKGGDGAEDGQLPLAGMLGRDVLERRAMRAIDPFSFVASRDARTFYGLVEPMPDGALRASSRQPILQQRFFDKGEQLIRTSFEKFRQVLELSLLDTERGQNIAILQMGLSNADPTQTAQKLKQLKKQQHQMALENASGGKRRTLGNLVSPDDPFPESIFGTNKDFYMNYKHPVKDKESLDFYMSAVELTDFVEHMTKHRRRSFSMGMRKRWR